MVFQQEIDLLIEEARKIDPATIIYLAGSYARGSPQKNSDIDLLIIHAETDQLKKRLTELFKDNYPVFWNKLDIKLFTEKDLIKARQTDYFMLYCNVTYGKCLVGTPLNLKLIPELIRQEINTWEAKLNEIDDYIEAQLDYEALAGLLFAIGKQLSFIETVLTGKRQSMKNIFQADTKMLGRSYEKRLTGKKQFQSSFSDEITLNHRVSKAGDFTRLKAVSTQLHSYISNLRGYFDHQFL